MTCVNENNIKYFIQYYSEPVIFKGFLNNWTILQWSLKDWETQLGELKLQFRKNYFAYSEEPHWERTCESVYMSMADFIKFQSNNDNESWLYFDYKYMMEWLKTQQDLLNGISWQQFGYPELSGNESTIWIGSKGAHTPCHMDSYGCNLIAQIYGRKEWIIFPPEENLRATRVPYEESSIYSKLNFFTPNAKKFKGITKARVVTLNPGEVLFLPPKWWHYVENIETAISVNIWLPMLEDNRMRVEEAITQMLILQFIKDLTPAEQNLILNSNKEEVLDTTISNSLTLLEKVIDIYKNQTPITEDVDNKETRNEKLKDIYEVLLKNEKLKTIKTLSSNEFENLLNAKEHRYITNKEMQVVPQNSRIDMLEKVINSICHPTTLSAITNKLLND